jgi:hypothetical protein
MTATRARTALRDRENREIRLVHRVAPAVIW